MSVLVIYPIYRHTSHEWLGPTHCLAVTVSHTVWTPKLPEWGNNVLRNLLGGNINPEKYCLAHSMFTFMLSETTDL